MQLNIPFVKSVFDYMCSENVLSMFLAFKGIRISPEELRERGCNAISTITKCLTAELNQEYLLVETTREFQTQMMHSEFANFIKHYIDNQEPIIASIIPDTNWELYLKERKDIPHYFHSILIVGYIPHSDFIFSHDQAPFEEWSFQDFLKRSARTNFLFVIRADLLAPFSHLFKKTTL